jgi:UDP-N-acetylmuramate dehydrogenase
MNLKYQEIIEELGKKRVKIEEPLAPYTTFKIGGPADLIYKAKTTDELVRAAKLARELEIPFFILGGGSNILVSDEGFRGLVIKLGNMRYKIQDTRIITDAGVKLGQLVDLTVKESLSGLEFAVGIPGTVGGAVRGNAGAWQQMIGNKVSRVKILNRQNKIEWIFPKDCYFSYRQSRFKKNGEIVLGAELILEKGNLLEIKKKISENRAKRHYQPKEPSAGCIFINPKPDSAGRMNAAQISSQHANFIVNLGKAKAKNVVQLIKLAKKEVKKKFGVDLKEEICLVGFDRM